MGVGNGLRQDVWREFQSRFGDVKMCEVYGSTEGNLCFMNHIGKIGTVGRSNFFYRVSSHGLETCPGCPGSAFNTMDLCSSAERVGGEVNCLEEICCIIQETLSSIRGMLKRSG